MIVFFGTARQMREYAREKNLHPQRDMVLAVACTRSLLGTTDRIDVVMAGDFEGYNSQSTKGLLNYIEAMNTMHGHTEEKAP